MKLSISNIAWTADQDEAVYEIMKKNGFTGLEIAPTRIFPDKPYNKSEAAHKWAVKLKQEYSLSVSSMQSIWFGRQEKLFGSEEERRILMDYTKKAVDFATAVGCRNLVFGCPQNRKIPEGADEQIAVSFFEELSAYAFSCGTAIGLEAIPLIYNTNYINDTLSALELIRKVNSKGFLLNLDVGALIQNGESIKELESSISFINHVHISEPHLKPVKKRPLHWKLKEILLADGYKGYISIEMGKVEQIDILEKKAKYIKEVFL